MDGFPDKLLQGISCWKMAFRPHIRIKIIYQMEFRTCL